MEKLPSQLVIHRHPTGTDSKWATYRNAYVSSPLHFTLGVENYGKFIQSQGTPYAYQPVDELWNQLDFEDSPMPPRHEKRTQQIPTSAASTKRV